MRKRKIRDNESIPLITICRHADTFNTCVRDDLDSCSELYKAFIQGLQEGYDKMCGVYNSGELHTYTHYSSGELHAYNHTRTHTTVQVNRTHTITHAHTLQFRWTARIQSHTHTHYSSGELHAYNHTRTPHLGRCIQSHTHTHYSSGELHAYNHTRTPHSGESHAYNHTCTPHSGESHAYNHTRTPHSGEPHAYNHTRTPTIISWITRTPHSGTRIQSHTHTHHTQAISSNNYIQLSFDQCEKSQPTLITPLLNFKNKLFKLFLKNNLNQCK